MYVEIIWVYFYRIGVQRLYRYTVIYVYSYHIGIERLYSHTLPKNIK